MLFCLTNGIVQTKQNDNDGVMNDFLSHLLVPSLIFSPNVSKVDGGVHGHQAIVLLQPYISMVDRGPPRELPLNDAICLHVYTREGRSPRRPRARARVSRRVRAQLADGGTSTKQNITF